MKVKNKVAKIQIKPQSKFRQNILLFVLIGGQFAAFFAAVRLNSMATQEVSAADAASEIEKAIYTKQDFFGTEAFVPLPTEQARRNLAEIADNSPENPLILAKLADYDEKLGRFDEAEKSLIRLSEIDAAKTDALAAYYERRGAYQKEAEVLRKMLFTIEAKNRAAVFERLIDLARRHELEFARRKIKLGDKS